MLALTMPHNFGGCHGYYECKVMTGNTENQYFLHSKMCILLNLEAEFFSRFDRPVLYSFIPTDNISLDSWVKSRKLFFYFSFKKHSKKTLMHAFDVRLTNTRYNIIIRRKSLRKTGKGRGQGKKKRKKQKNT